jgi:hypothetical protein
VRHSGRSIGLSNLCATPEQAPSRAAHQRKKFVHRAQVDGLTRLKHAHVTSDGLFAGAQPAFDAAIVNQSKVSLMKVQFQTVDVFTDGSSVATLWR